MRVALAVPRYRFIWPAAERWLVESALELRDEEMGVVYVPGNELMYLSLPEARHAAVRFAKNAACDVLCMVDADTYLSGFHTALLVDPLLGPNPPLDVVGAPYECRNRPGVPGYCLVPPGEPVGEEWREKLVRAIDDREPLEIRGFVGGGILAIRLAALEGVPQPWFRQGGPREGEDQFFGEVCRKHGLRMGIHFGCRSAVHYGAAEFRAERMIDRMRAALGPARGRVR